MFTLRPYQREALSALVAQAPRRQFLLLQAATGAGKTVVFCALARYYFSRWGMRTLVLAHRSILVRQAMDKLLQEWPDGEEGQDGAADNGIQEWIPTETDMEEAGKRLRALGVRLRV